MGEMASRFQEHLKKSSGQMLLLFLRVFLGILVGITVATVFQVLLSFDRYLYIFFILLTTMVLVRLTRGWSFVKLLVLTLVLVLVGILIRFYVMMAASS